MNNVGQPLNKRYFLELKGSSMESDGLNGHVHMLREAHVTLIKLTPVVYSPFH